MYILLAILVFGILIAVHELGRADQRVAAHMQWMQGRLEDEEPAASWQLPRGVWTAFQSAVGGVARPSH